MAEAFESDPQLALQVTAVLVVLVTVAAKFCVALVCRVIVLGDTVMETGGGFTVTLACADLVPSATLVAVTVQLVASPGAV